MKRLIAAGLMFGNLVEVSSAALVERTNRAMKHLTGKTTAPHPHPLPTRGRGGPGLHCRVRLRTVAASPPTPPLPLVGRGWGALGAGRAP